MYLYACVCICIYLYVFISIRMYYLYVIVCICKGPGWSGQSVMLWNISWHLGGTRCQGLRALAPGPTNIHCGLCRGPGARAPAWPKTVFSLTKPSRTCPEPILLIDKTVLSIDKTGPRQVQGAFCQ